MTFLDPFFPSERIKHSVTWLILEDMSLGDTTYLVHSDTLIKAHGQCVCRRADTKHDLDTSLGEPMIERFCRASIGCLVIPELTEDIEASDDSVSHAPTLPRPCDEASDAVFPLVTVYTCDHESNLSISTHQPDKGGKASILLTRKVVVHQVIILHLLPRSEERRLGQEGRRR